MMQDLASEAMEESAAGGEFNSIELSLENKTKEILEKSSASARWMSSLRSIRRRRSSCSAT